ncbi:hypothetical protein [Endozoicomonas euniceicola]|uniref:Uncharacterized protein n=1 Tax=Endozoicomonas euniceicola TaxID=1234143 RepID=A0ABY6GW94_9GAMM|nr:hypothetical protein [Endozoicomonas euniceicola]UYM17037.1 hypothetical protein NX720_03670 [Endozoicomonas euniceicola]
MTFPVEPNSASTFFRPVWSVSISSFLALEVLIQNFHAEYGLDYFKTMLNAREPFNAQ